MERQRNIINNKQQIRFSRENGYDTGSPERNRQMETWWRTFQTLAHTPSEGGSDMGPMKQVVREIYSQTHFQRQGVLVEEIQHGPLVVTIPEYNPDNREFTPRILAGHLDTVKGTKRNPHIQDGIVYSNGPSIDNKAPVAAIITVTDALVANNIPHPQLRVVLTTDEETDSRQIELVPVGSEERTFIADKSGPIGTLVLGSGGYTGIQANIANLSDERMREFLVRFDKRLGHHAIARRRESLGDLPKVLQGRQFSIQDLIIGPNNSRNTVASEGSMYITAHCPNTDDAPQVFTALQQWTSPLGAAVHMLGRDGAMQGFEVLLHGKAGHTSKVGTAEDDGMTTVFTDAAALLAPFVNTGDIAPLTNQEVRVNVGSMSIRRGQEANMELAGEARYRNSEDARMVLSDLQNLVKEFGGSMESVEENRAYRLDRSTPSVKEMQAVLEANGYDATFLAETFGISDANNAPKQWNTVVFSDGSINPHRSDEAISLESVSGLLNIFYDLATGRKSIV